MLPIVANIVARQSTPTVKGSFILSSSYGLGVATAYGLLGMLIAYLGASVGLLGLLQSPIVLISFALVFVLLGLYMLEIINIRLPLKLTQLLNNTSQKGDAKLGSAGGSFSAGLLSALVVSPCVSAPLSGVLIAVSTVGNIPLGFLALFSLGFGLSLPMVVFATTEGKLLPKAGEWMNKVKQGFAYLMFAVALMMLERIIHHPIILVLWSVWFIIIAVWLWQLSAHIQSAINWIFKGVSLIAGLWALVLLFGALQGNFNSLKPLSPQQKNNTPQVDMSKIETDTQSTQKLVSKLPDLKVTTLTELDEILSSHDQVIVDVMADWCIECKIMEEEVFKADSVVVNNKLASWQLVKFDITETSEDSKALLNRYNLVGPPTLIYYSRGQAMTKQVGKTSKAEFVELINQLETIKNK